MTISLISLLPSPYPPSLSIAVSCSSSAAPCPLQLQCLFACMWAWLWGRTNRVNGVKSEGVSSRRPPDNSASLALFISLAQLAAATTSLTHYLWADWYQYPPSPPPRSCPHRLSLPVFPQTSGQQQQREARHQHYSEKSQGTEFNHLCLYDSRRPVH